MKPFQSTRLIRFLGGYNLIFVLLILILIGIVLFIYSKVSFIFYPFLVIISTVAPPVVLALIAYYLLNPFISLMEKLRIKRIWGIIILILGIIGFVTGLVLLSAPSIEAQLKDLADSFPKYVTKSSEGIKSWIDNSFFGPYFEDVYEWVTTMVSNLPSMIYNYLGGATEGIVNVASKITQIVVTIITFPFILFFLLKDSNKFKRYILKLLPPPFRKDAARIIRNMDTQVGSYIQGQIIVASCIGVLLYIGYLIIGLDYAILLAMIAALTSVVPYLGPIIAISPAIIIAFVSSPFMLVKLAIVWASVQFLEGNFISPNIMGRTMKIHPLTIMLTLLISGKLFGIVGVILGIPGYAILKVIVTYMYSKFKRRYNRFYGDGMEKAYEQNE